MIRVGILDLSGCEDLDFLAAQRLPERIKNKIEKTQNPTEKILRTGAYLLLYRMCGALFSSSEMPEIIYTPHGKPRFCDNNYCHFNISHDKDAVAVAISSREVGIDIERCEVSAESAERISKRYAEALSAIDGESENVPEVSFSFFAVRGGEISEAETNPHIKEDSVCDFSSRWTRLEAALKLDGGGFASIGFIKEVAEKTSIKTVIIELGGQDFALSIAEKT